MQSRREKDERTARQRKRMSNIKERKGNLSKKAFSWTK